MTDKFHQGATGNLAADVDVATGKVKRIITRVGLNLNEASHHPDTGRELTDLAIPNWDQYIDVCHRATAAFPAIRLQHWDVAVTDRGPVLLELNTFGDFDMPQFVAGRGLLTPLFRDTLNSLSKTYRGKGDY